MKLTAVDRKKGRVTQSSNENQRFELWLERFIANGATNASKALSQIGYEGAPSRLRITASQYLKRAKAEGLLEKRLAEVKEAMGADEVIRATSAMARGEDPAMVELMEIVHKADMTDFSTVREFPGEKEGAPGVEAVVSDLVSAHRKGLMRYVKELRPTNAGMVVKLESRADALKAFISAKKSALDSMAKIRGLGGEEKPQAPTIILNILDRLPTATLQQLREKAIEIEAEVKE